MTRSRLLACLHDVEPATLERCMFIRDWLGDRGVDRATLLAIPHGADGALDPTGGCAGWLRARAAAGDAVAQHGTHHRRSRPAGPLRDWIADRQGGDAAEFVGLTDSETATAIDQGRDLLAHAGLAPRGFVAPAYAYTPALRRHLRRRFTWYAGLLAIHGRQTIAAPAHGLGTSTTLKRTTSPTVMRLGTRLPSEILRVDMHPADFDIPGHVRTLDAVLHDAATAIAMTYDQVAA
jgi:predicted deacetylase